MVQIKVVYGIILDSMLPLFCKQTNGLMKHALHKAIFTKTDIHLHHPNLN